METKGAKVIMLSTEEPTGLFTDSSGQLYFSIISKVRNNNEGKHLYFITDDKVKRGDWFYHITYNKAIYRAEEIGKTIICAHNGQSFSKSSSIKKIIATTDPNLIISNGEETVAIASGFKQSFEKLKSLPQPSQAFIEKYCKAGGIDEVEIEYLRGSDGYYDENDNWRWKLLVPKVDPNHNTITIHPIKDSWNREEVIELLSEIWYMKNITRERFHSLDKWIEENL